MLIGLRLTNETISSALKSLRSDNGRQSNVRSEPACASDGISTYTEFFAKKCSMDEVHAKHPKWFGTFPYAYMTGPSISAMHSPSAKSSSQLALRGCEASEFYSLWHTT